MIQAFIAAACTTALLVQVDPPRKDHPEITCRTDSSGRFLALERDGNGPDRAGRIIGPKRRGYVSVFEYLGEGKSLRKLYEAELLNHGVPLICSLSRDGRFFVTLDEFNAAGTSPFTVVIYDLARKEHTTYAGKDFLSEKLIKSLGHQGFVPGFKWHGKDMDFNQDSTRFYPTRPENCKKEEVPFVVIDLPTRTVRVEPIPATPLTDLVPDVQQEWGWRESRETVATKTTILPVRITRSRPGHPDRVLELAPNKTEYIARQDQHNGQRK